MPSSWRSSWSEPVPGRARGPWTADRFGARSVFRAAIFVFMQLSPNAGAEMSGHGRKPTVQDAMDHLGEPAEAVRRRG